MKWYAEIKLTEQSDRKTVMVDILVKNEKQEPLFVYRATTHDAYLCFRRGWHWKRNLISMYCRHAAASFNASLRLTNPITDITATTAVLHPSTFETHRFDYSKKIKP